MYYSNEKLLEEYFDNEYFRLVEYGINVIPKSLIPTFLFLFGEVIYLTVN